jgi:hypothetical protein
LISIVIPGGSSPRGTFVDAFGGRATEGGTGDGSSSSQAASTASITGPVNSNRRKRGDLDGEVAFMSQLLDY